MTCTTAAAEMGAIDARAGVARGSVGREGRSAQVQAVA
jgi:hypothetical protein